MTADTTLTDRGRQTTEARRGQGNWGRVAGAVLLVIGTLSLLHSLGLMTEAEARYIIPVGMVAVGAYLLLRGRRAG